MAYEHIQRLLEERGKTQNQLAEILGRTPAVVTNLFNGIRLLKANEIQKIADWLSVSPEMIMSGSGGIKQIPIRGFVPGGCPVEVFDQPVDEYLNYPVKGNVKNHYALRVVGDSMNRVVADGSYVVVDSTRRNASELDGKLVIARNNGECTFKRLCLNPNLLMPESNDKSYKPIAIDDDWEIIGLVIGSVSKFED